MRPIQAPAPPKITDLTTTKTIQPQDKPKILPQPMEPTKDNALSPATINLIEDTEDMDVSDAEDTSSEAVPGLLVVYMPANVT